VRRRGPLALAQSHALEPAPEGDLTEV